MRQGFFQRECSIHASRANPIAIRCAMQRSIALTGFFGYGLVCQGNGVAACFEGGGFRQIPAEIQHTQPDAIPGPVRVAVRLGARAGEVKRRDFFQHHSAENNGGK